MAFKPENIREAAKRVLEATNKDGQPIRTLSGESRRAFNEYVEAKISFLQARDQKTDQSVIDAQRIAAKMHYNFYVPLTKEATQSHFERVSPPKIHSPYNKLMANMSGELPPPEAPAPVKGTEAEKLLVAIQAFDAETNSGFFGDLMKNVYDKDEGGFKWKGGLGMLATTVAGYFVGQYVGGGSFLATFATMMGMAMVGMAAGAPVIDGISNIAQGKPWGAAPDKEPEKIVEKTKTPLKTASVSAPNNTELDTKKPSADIAVPKEAVAMLQSSAMRDANGHEGSPVTPAVSSASQGLGGVV